MTDQYLRSFGNKISASDSQTINPTLVDINLYNKSLLNSGLEEIHDIASSPIRLTLLFTPIKSHHRHCHNVNSNDSRRYSSKSSTTNDMTISPFTGNNGNGHSNNKKEQPEIVLHFGKYILDAWYPSPFPAEYLVATRSTITNNTTNTTATATIIKKNKEKTVEIHMCQVCLKYFRNGKLLEIHVTVKHATNNNNNENENEGLIISHSNDNDNDNKNESGIVTRENKLIMTPPGWEIYRDSSISIFEIDGSHYKVSKDILI